MTAQLYLQKAEMQFARGLEEKALESLLAALGCQDGDTVSETQVRCLLGEYRFVHQQYAQAQEQFSWISDQAEQLEHDYDDLLNDEIRKAGAHTEIPALLRIIKKGATIVSYDLMVFEKAKAPAVRKEFMVWYEKQMEWSEEHDYQSIHVSSPSLQNWFMEMIEKFPPMNGEYAPNLDSLDEAEAEELERHLVDYSIGRDMIYAAFSWSMAEEAYEQMRSLAQKHGVGFFDVSGEKSEIILPDGTMI